MAAPDADPTLDTLLGLMQAGDLRALDMLARTYGKRLAWVARRWCQSPSDAEDAVQQALLAAKDAMAGYRGEGSALAWLSTLVARTCTRLNAQASRRGPLEDADCGCGDLSAELEQQALSRQLGDALMTLSRTDRLAFLLAAEGFTGEEIAQRFGVTANAVRSRLKRARKVLRQALEDGDTPSGAGGTEDVNPAASGATRHASAVPRRSRNAQPRSQRVSTPADR